MCTLTLERRGLQSSLEYLYIVFEYEGSQTVQGVKQRGRGISECSRVRGSTHYSKDARDR